MSRLDRCRSKRHRGRCRGHLAARRQPDAGEDQADPEESDRGRRGCAVSVRNHEASRMRRGRAARSAVGALRPGIVATIALRDRSK